MTYDDAINLVRTRRDVDKRKGKEIALELHGGGCDILDAANALGAHGYVVGIEDLPAGVLFHVSAGPKYGFSYLLAAQYPNVFPAIVWTNQSSEREE